MSAPDFILIGAMKCGTSTLAAQLGAQAGLFMTDPKEPNYFSDDAVFARGADWYAALFEDAGAGEIKGEASTHYTKRPEYPETVQRMKAALPEVRLIYMIRDPMPRLVSHYMHGWSEGVYAGSLAEALESDNRLVDYGCYGWQIEPYINAYGKEAILLTSLERLKADPSGELSRIAAHLGHEGAVAWRDDLERENVSAERMRPFPMQRLLIDNPVATFLRRTLVPKSLRTRIRSTRQMHERPVIPADRVDALQARFLEDGAALAAHFPADPSFDLVYPWAHP